MKGLLKYGLWCLLLIGCRTTAPAQSRDLPDLLFHHLDNEHGLTANSATFLYNDHCGYLWIATENGLNRFDGLTCKSYRHNSRDPHSLPGNYCNKIIEDQEGNLWIGTQNALARYNREQDNFSSCYFFTDPQTRQAIAQYTSPFFIDARNRLWLYLGYKGSVFCYDPHSRRLDSVTSLSNGFLFAQQPFYTPLRQYISRGVKGIYLNQVQDTRHTGSEAFFTDGNRYGQPAAYVADVYQDQDTLLWLCTDIGFLSLDPASGNYRIYTDQQGQTCAANCLTPYTRRYFFVGTTGRGLLLFDRIARRFVRQYSHVGNDPLSIASNTVNCCLLRKGNLFVSAADYGVDYTNVRQALFPHYLNRQEANGYKLENNVSAFAAPDSNTLWCGTRNNGIIVIDRRSGHLVRQYHTGNTPALAADNIQEMQRLRNGDILIRNADEYALYEASSGRFRRLPAGNNLRLKGRIMVHRIQYLWDSTLTAVTENGFAVVQLADSIYFHFISAVNQPAEWPHFQFLHQVNDSLLLLQTFFTHLYAYHYRQGQYRMIREIAHTAFRTNGAVSRGDSTWLATSAGLKLVDTRTLKLSEDLPLQTPCNGIAAVPGDKYLWITAASGLYRYHAPTGTFTRFTVNDGLQDNLFNTGALFMPDAHTIAAGGVNGFNLFDPARLPEPKQEYTVLPDQIQINDTVLPGRNAAFVRQLNLPYNKNTIGFSFTAVGFDQVGQSRIRYQLEPYDAQPLAVNGKGNARYAQLPAGHYRFLLFSGNDTRPVHTISIYISPPWWQTWWFRILLFFTTIILIGWLLRKRIRDLRKRQQERMQIMIYSQEEERRRIARDLHDDFGARLSTLKLYVQAAEQKKDPEDLLRQSSVLIDQVIRELRNILLNLSPQSLEENGLQATLQELAEHLNQSGVLQCAVDISAFRNPLKPSAAYALFRICQELVSNTLKYAQARHIYISIVQRTEMLVFLYEDDGIGFDLQTVQRGYGITNIQTHVQAFNGSLLLDTSPGKGLAVTIELPLSLLRHPTRRS